jgi:hypothetical protein
MKNVMKKVEVAGYVLLVGAIVTLLAVACSASAVWGS